MKYLELIKEQNEELKERYELVSERVAELAADAKEAIQWTYFAYLAAKFSREFFHLPLVN